MERQTKAYLFGLAAVLCWSTVASAFKLSLRRLDHIQLVFWASVFSIVALAAVMTVQGTFGRIFAYSRTQYARSLIMGLLNPFLYYLVLFKAYDLLPAQEAQPINYTWAVTLALLSIPLLGQKISRWDLLALAASYSGVVVIATRGDPASFRFSNPLGVGLALGSTIIWALYWIYSTKDDREPAAGLFLNFVFGLPFTAAACIIFSDPLDVSALGLAGAAYVGFFEMGLTFVLWLSALRLSINTAKVGNLIFISPFLSLVFIHFLVGETIYGSTYVGLALIICGLLIQSKK